MLSQVTGPLEVRKRRINETKSTKKRSKEKNNNVKN